MCPCHLRNLAAIQVGFFIIQCEFLNLSESQSEFGTASNYRDILFTRIGSFDFGNKCENFVTISRFGNKNLTERRKQFTMSFRSNYGRRSGEPR